MPSFLSSLFGSKPQVPTLPSLDLGAEQQKSIAANQAALPGAEKLVGAANQFSIGQINQMLEQAIPGYSSIAKTISGNIASEAQGQIPSDVVAQEQNLTAAQALQGGYGGSGAHGNLTARDLGLTSLDLTQQALTSAESWTKTAASLYEPSMVNVSSMFVSPEQQYQADNQQNLQQFQRQWMANQISAMPDPTTVGLWNTTWSIIDSVLSAYTGGDMSGMGTVPAGGYGGAGNAGGGFGGINFGAGGNTDWGGMNEGTTVAG